MSSLLFQSDSLSEEIKNERSIVVESIEPFMEEISKKYKEAMTARKGVDDIANEIFDKLRAVHADLVSVDKMKSTVHERLKETTTANKKTVAELASIREQYEKANSELQVSKDQLKQSQERIAEVSRDSTFLGGLFISDEVVTKKVDFCRFRFVHFFSVC